ncbi:hypothetical protein AGABI1DRAFT_134358 [Agaricus bisporus var. burnettii JB137-S8]|uniref:Uncharacterized protein n=1 Tax=Agaricus bisporus var. burnettii (strain JB137-S8 / ATCC MYA-4627 / FGSC 10392) TaxID=597362 RepID=K5WSE5_AGABU|nr:uncharacterized protein AGABI1DRAFT_134358 [Agaricus bisporus var. burnettii JB137-S8]EKM73643.1 hypothetical protein AGABI1DRAFT_134358 [Agaricus bisporus var. burnettii JB137-S8]
MPRKSNKSSTPAPVPHPYRPPSQAPSPPANPNAARIVLGDIIPMLEHNIPLTTFHLDFHENRAIVDAVRNRGIAPETAIANAAASALAKGNVKGPSGQSTGIGAAPPAVKTPPRVPTPPPSCADALTAGAHSSPIPSSCTVAFGFRALLEHQQNVQILYELF